MGNGEMTGNLRGIEESGPFFTTPIMITKTTHRRRRGARTRVIGWAVRNRLMDAAVVVAGGPPETYDGLLSDIRRLFHVKAEHGWEALERCAAGGRVPPKDALAAWHRDEFGLRMGKGRLIIWPTASRRLESQGGGRIQARNPGAAQFAGRPPRADYRGRSG